MRRPRLDQLASAEARRFVRAQARVVAQRVERWSRLQRDDDALHDVRTALRRLRVLVRSFRGPLGPVARKGVRRRLREAMRVTSPLRDADVFVLWVQTIPATPVTRHLIATVGVASQSTRKHACRVVNSTWREAYRRIKALSRQGPRPSEPTFGVASARALRRELRVLDAGLEAFDPVRASASVHQTRIAAKRVRYLLETLLPRSPDVRRPVEWCRSLQGLVGEWRDAALAAGHLRRCPRMTGRDTVYRRLRERRRQALRALQEFVADSGAWRIAKRDGAAIARRLALAGGQAKPMK